MRVKQINEEVLFADDRIVRLEARDIEFLKERARCSKRKQMRLCAHKDIDDKLHEMLIVHSKETYVRPHKHLNKTESFHVIEGLVDVILFDERGKIVEVIRMGDYLSGCEFYYRISDPYYHTLLIRSEVLVFHETTNGPFRRSDTIFAPWAPDESETVDQKEYMEQLARDIESFVSEREKHV